MTSMRMRAGRLLACAAAVMSVGCGVAGVLEAQDEGANASELSVTAVGDTYVRSGKYASRNFGAAAELKADQNDGGDVEMAFLKFQLQESGPIANVTLRLFVIGGSNDAVDLYATSVAWDEKSLTWASRPAAEGAPIATLVKTPKSGGYVTLDVTALARPGLPLALVLVPRSADSFIVGSRERLLAGERPQLLVTLAAADAGEGSIGSDAGRADTGTDAGSVETGADAGRADTGTDAGSVETGADAGRADIGTDAGSVGTGTDAGCSSPLGPSAPWHYSGNGNFSNGVFLPGAAGFNLADVSSASQANALPEGLKALVWVGQCNGVDSTFLATLRPFVGNASKVFGFYLYDEPDPTGQWNAPACPAANLKAESDWIHANIPGAKTVILLMNMGSSANPSFAGTYTPANSGIDLYGVDPYPCRVELGGCDFTMIPKAVTAAVASGIPKSALFPVYQSFGGGGWTTDTDGSYLMPSPEQTRQLLAAWAQALPEAELDYAYSWGTQNGDTALVEHPEVQAVYSLHNAGCGGTPAAACGDRACNGTESCSSCPGDCGPCPASCGDGVCNGMETCSSCPGDCGPCPASCGDRTCSPTETCSSCAADCGACGSDFTLAVASDCHYGAGSSALAGANNTHALAKSWNPDAYILTGDLVDDSSYFPSVFATSAWAQSKALIHPTVGNHDWHDGGVAYEAFWPESQRGPNGLDYYSWVTPNGWLVIHMNFKEGSGTEIRQGQTQYNWVHSQLDAHPNMPIIALYHDHRYSDAPAHGDNTSLTDVWNLLMQHGADLLISGHNHVYERFPLMDANGNTSNSGLRQFLAGTCGMVTNSSGTPWYPWAAGGDGSNQGRSEYRQNHHLGALKLTLQPHAYTWTFYKVDGTVLDTGTQATHN